MPKRGSEAVGPQSGRDGEFMATSDDIEYVIAGMSATDENFAYFCNPIPDPVKAADSAQMSKRKYVSALQASHRPGSAQPFATTAICMAHPTSRTFTNCFPTESYNLADEEELQMSLPTWITTSTSLSRR